MSQQGIRRSALADETRAALKRSFLHLYKDIPVQKITVKQITDGAGTGRGAFYYHYENVFDLLSSVENEIIQGVCGAIRAGIPPAPPKADNAVVSDSAEFSCWLSLLSFLEANCAALLVLTQKSDDFVEKLYCRIKSQLMDPAKEGLLGMNFVRGNYATELFAYGCVTICIRWLEDGMPVSKEALAEEISGAAWMKQLRVIAR